VETRTGDNVAGGDDRRDVNRRPMRDERLLARRGGRASEGGNLDLLTRAHGRTNVEGSNEPSERRRRAVVRRARDMLTSVDAAMSVARTQRVG
jgi:hypothetical protein